MNRACASQNANLHEQNQHASSIRPLKMNFVRMKSVLLLAASLLISASTYANSDSNETKKANNSPSVTRIETGNALQIKGLVVDQKNKETLAGAKVVVDGKKYYSDLDGNFTIAGVKPGKYDLTVEMISYEPVTLELDLTVNRSVSVSLMQK